MTVDLGIWEWLRRLLLGLVIAAGCVFLAVCFLPLIDGHKLLQSQIYQMRQDLVEEQRQIYRLKTDIEAFGRPVTIEILARERLGFARPGESVFRLEPQPAEGGLGGPVTR